MKKILLILATFAACHTTVSAPTTPQAPQTTLYCFSYDDGISDLTVFCGMEPATCDAKFTEIAESGLEWHSYCERSSSIDFVLE